jgi:glutaredoxin-related protein
MILYSNNCPRCRVLKSELEKKNIDFTVSTDFSKIIDKNIFSVPCLEKDDGTVMLFTEAIKYIQGV